MISEGDKQLFETNYGFLNCVEAAALQQTIQKAGVEEALFQYSQLEKDHPLVMAIKEQIQLLK